MGIFPLADPHTSPHTCIYKGLCSISVTIRFGPGAARLVPWPNVTRSGLSQNVMHLAGGGGGGGLHQFLPGGSTAKLHVTYHVV